MSKIALSGNASGTGTFTIASPNSNSDRTLNLPDNSGTVLTSASNLVGVTGVGKVLQVVSANPTLSFSTTSGTFASIGLSASITPSSASSKIFIVATFLENSQSSNLSLQTALFRGATQLDITTGQYAASAGWLQTTNTTTFLDSPATTSSTTYTIQARVSAGGGTLSFTDKSSIVLMEIAA